MATPSSDPANEVFVTGGTGYIGRELIRALLARNRGVRALVRPGSERKLASGVRAVAGDALARGAWEREIPRGGTFVHLIGTPKPSPWKAEEFERVDLTSVLVATEAARDAGVAHFMYLSVARPAPVMRAYQRVREQGELAIRAAGLDATFVRPWYVIGPGHRWPLAMLPIYKALELVPATREPATRLGFVTLAQMTTALVDAVEYPARGVRVLGVPEIRAARL